MATHTLVQSVEMARDMSIKDSKLDASTRIRRRMFNGVPFTQSDLTLVSGKSRALSALVIRNMEREGFIFEKQSNGRNTLITYVLTNPDFNPTPKATQVRAQASVPTKTPKSARKVVEAVKVTDSQIQTSQQSVAVIPFLGQTWRVQGMALNPENRIQLALRADGVVEPLIVTL